MMHTYHYDVSILKWHMKNDPTFPIMLLGLENDSPQVYARISIFKIVQSGTYYIMLDIFRPYWAHKMVELAYFDDPNNADGWFLIKYCILPDQIDDKQICGAYTPAHFVI